MANLSLRDVPAGPGYTVRLRDIDTDEIVLSCAATVEHHDTIASVIPERDDLSWEADRARAVVLEVLRADGEVVFTFPDTFMHNEHGGPLRQNPGNKKAPEGAEDGN